MAIGQISGPLLSKNLLRNGSDLAFETDLLYLDVHTKKIGIKTDSPATDLFIDDTIRTTDLIGENSVTIANVSFNGDSSISTTIGPLYLVPNTPNPYINFTNLQTASLEFTDNTLKSKDNADIHLYPATGKEVKIFSNTNIYGSLHATGDVTFDGSITFGDDADDSVTFASDIKSNIVPDLTDTYSLGSDLKRWKQVRASNVKADTLYSVNLTIDGIDTTLRQGNIYYVSKSGIDTNSGTHQNNTFLTIKKALEVAVAGDHVQIYPGNYEEEFPLTVPAGVSVRGAGIRSVNITPTVSTQTEDCFLLNGETTVEDLSVKDFYYESSTDTGYAFKFAPNFTVTTRSPYIKNVSVITKESAGGLTPVDIYVDPLGLAGSYSSDSVAVDQINYTQSQVESWIGKLLMTWNGETVPVTFYEIIDVIEEPLDPGMFWRIVLDRTLETAGEEFFQFSIYPNEALTSIVGTAGYTAATDYSRSFLKAGLPPFFATTVTEDWTCQIGESLNIIDSVEEDPLYSTWWKVNFKDIATPTNGLPIFTSPSGSSTMTAGRGALVDGSVATALSNEASMLFHSVTFITPNSVALMMTNGARVEWLNSFTYYATKGLYATQGTLGFASLGTKFGAELRSIGSANVYGLVGAEADGADTLMYLVQHNFGYIGTGTDSDNDSTLIVQEDEVVKLNGGKVYYTSQDQEGDFRVGDVFFADYQSGLTSFDTTGVDLTGFSALQFQDGNNVTYVNADYLQTGNLKIQGNDILSLSGGLILSSASNEINFLENVNIHKNLDVVGNFNLDGALYFGNQATDTLTFNTSFDQNLTPKDQLQDYNLGSPSNVWKTVYISESVTDTVNINSNIITAGTDENLVLLGTDHVLVEQLTIRNNTISNEVAGASTVAQKSIIFNVDGTGVFDINATNSLKMPTGTSVNMPTLTTGDFRFNTTIGNFEGEGGLRFIDLQSSNGQTKVTPELTRGANDNTIRFYTANTVRSDINATRFRTDKLLVSSIIDFDNNQISTVTTNANLYLVPDGTGVVKVGNLELISDSITNSVDTVTLIQPTGTGYVEFSGTGAVQLPAGSNLERPTTMPIGSTRWNTTGQYMEVYGPNGWQVSTGSGADINAEAMEEITNLWALVLG